MRKTSSSPPTPSSTAAPATGPNDLTVPLVTAAATSVESGQPLTVTFEVANSGPGEAPASRARLRLSADANLTLYDLPLALDVAVPPVPAGGSVTVTGTYTVPETTVAGDYYVGVFARLELPSRPVRRDQRRRPDGGPDHRHRPGGAVGPDYHATTGGSWHS